MSNENSVHTKVKISEADIKKIADEYEKLNEVLEQQLSQIEEMRTNLRTQRLHDEVNHEDLMFLVADMKHMAFMLHLNSLKADAVAKADLGEIEANIKLGKANDILKSYGFTAATDDLRKSAINSLPQMTRLRKAVGKIQAFSKSLEGLVENLQSEEVNYRKSTERRERYNGGL